FQVVRAEFPIDRYAVLKAARPDLVAELFEAVETGAGEIAIVKLDGRPVIVLGPWLTRVYWKVATRVEVERIDVAREPKVAPRRPARDAHRVPPDRRSGARGRRGRGRGRMALPAGAVRDPRGGRRAHARRGARGQERARRGAACIRARAPRRDRHRGDRARRE